jgi:hypothetical protein
MLLLAPGCASDPDADADGVRADGNVRVIDLPDGPTGILPTRGVTSNPVGPPDAWRARTIDGVIELDPAAVEAADFAGGPEVGLTVTTEPVAPDSPEGEQLHGLVEVPVDWWQRAMENPAADIVLAEHHVSFAPDLDAEVTFRGSVARGFTYHVQVDGVGFGFQPCTACENGAVTGHVIEIPAGVIGLLVLPPGTSHVDVDREHWLLQDPAMRGALVVVRFEAVGDTATISFVDSAGSSVSAETTAIVDA